MNSQRVAGRAPMPAQRGIDSFMHSSAGGFCTVCGTVWPCSQAGKQSSTQQNSDKKVMVTSSS